MCFKQEKGTDYIILTSASDRELQKSSNAVNAGTETITEGVALSKSFV